MADVVEIRNGHIVPLSEDDVRQENLLCSFPRIGSLYRRHYVAHHPVHGYFCFMILRDAPGGGGGYEAVYPSEYVHGVQDGKVFRGKAPYYGPVSNRAGIPPAPDGAIHYIIGPFGTGYKIIQILGWFVPEGRKHPYAAVVAVHGCRNAPIADEEDPEGDAVWVPHRGIVVCSRSAINGWERSYKGEEVPVQIDLFSGWISEPASSPEKVE